jgi:aminoglycoside phosphotransferase (APT) family kinase protein
MASADWRFLLPRLQFGAVLCLGIPPLPTIFVLANMCESVLLVSTNRKRLRKVIDECAKRELKTVDGLPFSGIADLPCGSGAIDLIYVAAEKRFRSVVADEPSCRELARLLKPEGVVYFEERAAKQRRKGGEIKDHLAQMGLTGTQVFRLTPLNGELQTAIPAFDKVAAGYFESKVLSRLSLKSRLWEGVHQALGGERYGVVTRCVKHEVNGHLPDYLTSLAVDHGIKIDDYHWGMSARGRYNTRKVLFYLLRRDSGLPEFIIKLTRSSNFNLRLENEFHSLEALSHRNIVAPETYPLPLFFGHRGNLAILAERCISGKAFHQATKATLDCPYARAAMEWLMDLGAGSADATASTPSMVSETMTGLLKQFAGIYKLSNRDHSFLVKQIDAIAQSSAPLPTVFQHGDPGIWNVLATDREGIAFLDWEAAEPQGMPLWDVFYFLRSYGTWMARQRGSRDSLKSFSQNFFAPSALNALLVQLVQRYCERIQLDTRFIEPLFYLCWMHRALKEATRLTAARLESGHYISLLRRCIENRQAPGLAKLFSPVSSEV